MMDKNCVAVKISVNNMGDDPISANSIGARYKIP